MFILWLFLCCAGELFYCEIICFLPDIIGGLGHSGLPLMKMRHFWPLQTLRSNCFLKLQNWYQDGRVLNIELHFLFWSQQVQISILQIWIKRYKWNGFLQETNLLFLFSGKKKKNKSVFCHLIPQSLTRLRFSTRKTSSSFIQRDGYP